MKNFLFISVLALSFGANAQSIVCEGKKGSVLELNVSDLSAPAKSWDLSGNDGTNPFDCILIKTTAKRNTFSCSSFQGAPYGYLSLPVQMDDGARARFTYIDENDFRFTRQFNGTCTLK